MMRNGQIIAAMLIAFVLVFNVPIAYATTSDDTVSMPTKDSIFKHKYENYTVNYTKVDTVYGPVNVPEDSFKKLGKEKITEKYYEFLKQQDEFKQMDKQLGITKSYTSTNYTVVAPLQVYTELYDILLTDKYYERTWFYQTGYQPTLLYGCISPVSIYHPSGENFRSYHEREIVLNNYMDIIEIVSDQRPNGITNVFACIYDNSFYPVDPSVFYLNIPNSQHPVEYDVILNAMDHSYDIWLVDTGTWQVYFDSYTDSDNFSSYILKYSGSTELEDYSMFAHTFRVETNIVDYYTKVNGYIVQPYNVFNNINNSEETAWVYAYGYKGVGNNYQTFSNHIAGNPDPS